MSETPKPTPSDIGIPSPGHLLGKKREEYGWSTRDVARALRLSERQVLAIEADDYDSLPGKTYVMGYWRSYSQLLKFSIEESIQVHRVNLFGEVGEIAIHPGGKEVRTYDERSRVRSAILFAVLVAVVLGAIWYVQNPDASLRHWIQLGMERLDQNDSADVTNPSPSITQSGINENINEDAVTATEFIPNQDVASESEPAESVLTLPVPNFSENNDEQTTEINTRGYEVIETSFPLSALNLTYQSSTKTDPEVEETGNVQDVTQPDNTNVTSAPSQPNTTTTVAEPASSTEAENTGSTNNQAAGEETESNTESNTTVSDNNLVFQVENESWIDVRDSSGERLIYRTVNRGEDIRLKGVPPYSVFIGSAEGVKVQFQGKEVPFKAHESGLFARFEVGI